MTFVTKNFILYRHGLFKTKTTEERVTSYKEVGSHIQHDSI